jgi:hypothetical protein
VNAPTSGGKPLLTAKSGQFTSLEMEAMRRELMETEDVPFFSIDDESQTTIDEQ